MSTSVTSLKGKKNSGAKKTAQSTTHAQAKGLTFRSVFAKSDRHPFEDINWVTRSSRIQELDGTLVSEVTDVEAPETWSQLAVDIAATKYFRRTGVNTPTGSETSVKQLVSRVARAIRMAGEKMQGYFKSSEDATHFERDLIYLLVHQYGAFNSPVWFNCGLFESYEIKGPGGSFFTDLNTGKVTQAQNSYEHPQCSACFIQSVNDDLMGIFDLVKNEARIFKYGSGTGTNFSKIRGRNEKLSGGGTSSGLLSFLEVLDRAAGATKSGGTTRRAAKMVCLDMDHPEIEDFILWKSREEKKAKALIAAGFPADFNGEAYKTIAGQNANNSIRVTDEFMRAVENDQDWVTRNRTNGEVYKIHRARDLFRKAAEAAWECADPGIQFDSTINAWHTCKNTDRIYASNPCSEYMFLNDSACNLASLNLMKFWSPEKGFDVEKYRHAIRIFTTAQEILVDYSSYPTETIARNSHAYRPLGLGYANLGTLLMVNGLPYDSVEAREYAAALTAILSGHGYRVSAEIASQKEPFSGYHTNRDPMLEVIRKHQAAARKLQTSETHLIQAAQEDWDMALSLGEKYGYRNAQLTVLAPTGTIGLLMDCDTTGVEPDFSLVKFKKLAGGGFFKIINQSVPLALKRLGYTETQINEMVDYAITQGHMTLEGAPHLEPRHYAVFDCANRCGDGNRYIAPLGHVKMMAAVQPFLSGAISKTVNLPNETTVEEIEEVYLESWKLGLKAVAVYRDGCKSSQPLSSGKKESSKEKEVKSADGKTRPAESLARSAETATIISPPTVQRKKLPSKRTGFTQEARVAGHKIFLRTGEYEDGSLGEIFIDMHKEGAAFRSLMNCFAIAVSVGLQHGVPLQTYVDKFTFTKFEPHGPVDHPNIKFATSVIDYIFRVLGYEYLHRTDFLQVKPEDMGPATELSKPEKTKLANLDQKAHESSTNLQAAQTGDLEVEQQLKSLMGDAPFCDGCGHTTVRNGSCYKCLNCGNSMGCS